MILYLLLLIVIMTSIFVFRGSKEKKKIKLYAGLYKEFEIIEPRKSNAFDKPVVFATVNYLDAVLFCAQWSFYDFEFGYINNKGYLIERYPNALEQLNVEGYVHYLDSKNFHKDKKLPSSMMVSYHEIRPEKCVKINVLAAAKKIGLNITTNSELLEKMHIEIRKIKINEMYVPIDFNWKPEIEGAEYFYDFRDIFEPADKVIVNNFDGYNCRLIEYECKKKYLVIPKIYEKEPSNIDKAFANFMANMKIIYKNYETIFL